MEAGHHIALNRWDDARGETVSVSAVALIALRAESHDLGSSLVFYRLRGFMFDDGLGIHCNDTRSRLPNNFSQSRP